MPISTTRPPRSLRRALHGPMTARAVALATGVVLAAGTAQPAAADPGAAIEHVGTRYTLAADAGVSWYVPQTVTAGEPLTLSGTGWTTVAGAGSTIAVKIDGGAMTTKLDVVNPFDGSVSANKTIVAIAQADASGEWQVQIPFPTLASSNQDWAAGQNHTVTLLTGSLQTPAGTDKGRTTAAQPASVTVTAAEAPGGTEPPVEEPPTTVAPVVTAQPQPVTVAEGGTAVFTAAATGSPAPEVQWYAAGSDGSWTVVTGATSSTLSLASVTAAMDGTRYRAVFTSSAGTAQTDAATLTVTPMPADTRTYTVTDAAQRTVTYTVPTSVAPGQDIVVSGTGWLTADGTAGSVFSVMLDAVVSGDPNTVYTTRAVTNPLTGAIATDKRLQAIVAAAPDGSWTATIPYPTAANSSAGSTTPAWTAGTSHAIRFLSGTLRTSPADVARSLSATFTVAGDPEPGPTDAPSWAHDTVSYTDPVTGRVATAWVQQDVAAGDGATITIKGTGWVDQAGTGASTVAVKLNYGDGRQYTRTGAGIVEHPSASGDNTIWVLLAPSDPENHPNVIAIGPDGNFEVQIDAPAGLVAGQYLSVLLQSGRFDTADVLRTVTTGFLTVGGTPYSGGTGSQEQTCVPTSSTPTVTVVNPQVTVGGLLHVTGTGWCHPAALRGGSVVGFKIDEGAYSHLTGDLHQNTTIWAIVTADAADGTFDAELQLPDGTTSGANGSLPAFTEGSHTLRLLSGSLKTGDTVRSVQSAEFVVGAYRPNGAPDPVEATEGLTAATRGGVVVEQSSAALTVTVPGAVAGDWIFLTAYEENGSPRYPWSGTWFQADAAGRVVAGLAGVTLPVGTTKLAVQSGNQGEYGALLGWGYVTVAAPVDTGSGQTATVPSMDTSAAPATSAQPRVTVISATSPTPPSTVPGAPAATGDGLTADNAGDVVGAQDGTVVTITLPAAQPGDWVYLYAYSDPVPVGWVQVDAHRQVKVDVSLLPAGEHKIAVLDADGNLIGWTGATVAGAEEVVATDDGVTTAGGAASEGDAPAATAAAAESDDPGLSASDWWLAGGAAVLALAMIVGAVALRRRRGADTGAAGRAA